MLCSWCAVGRVSAPTGGMFRSASHVARPPQTAMAPLWHNDTHGTQTQPAPPHTRWCLRRLPTPHAVCVERRSQARALGLVNTQLAVASGCAGRRRIRLRNTSWRGAAWRRHNRRWRWLARRARHRVLPSQVGADPCEGGRSTSGSAPVVPQHSCVVVHVAQRCAPRGTRRERCVMCDLAARCIGWPKAAAGLPAFGGGRGE